jgi:plasmid maintenance system antidote protein VapI
MDEIADWMKQTNATQATAAEVLQVTRPRVSDVVNHKVEKFTIDALVSMLSRIGKRVHLVFGTIPLYRLWNQRADAGHRYTISAAIKAQMLAADYLAEGYGPDGVAMCAVQ